MFSLILKRNTNKLLANRCFIKGIKHIGDALLWENNNKRIIIIINLFVLKRIISAINIH